MVNYKGYLVDAFAYRNAGVMHAACLIKWQGRVIKSFRMGMATASSDEAQAAAIQVGMNYINERLQTME